jgi:uncharacterized membrane protein (DUF441 family)
MILNINWSLLAIFIIGLITRNNILAAASGIILVLGVLNLDQFYPLLERRGIEAGLLFLTMAILNNGNFSSIGRWEGFVQCAC